MSCTLRCSIIKRMNISVSQTQLKTVRCALVALHFSCPHDIPQYSSPIKLSLPLFQAHEICCSFQRWSQGQWQNGPSFVFSFSSHALPSGPCTPKLSAEVGEISGELEEAQLAPPPPLKFERMCFCFVFHFVSEFKNNKAQIAQESITIPESFRALGPSRKGLRVSRSWCSYAHIIFCAPSRNKNPGSAPGRDDWGFAIYTLGSKALIIT